MKSIRIAVVFLIIWVSGGVWAQEDKFCELEGVIEPSEIIALSSQIPGVLEKVIADRGDMVDIGQVVARLQSKVEKVEVALAEARVEFERRKLLRYEKLYQNDSISTHEMDELETGLQISELRLRDAKERFNLRTIVSPVRGIVVERLLSHGEYIGEEGAAMKIARIDPLYVEVIVPINYYGKIKKGTMALVLPELSVGGNYSCRVTVVDQVMDAASGTYGVRLELPNSAGRLPAGIKCRIRFHLK